MKPLQHLNKLSEMAARHENAQREISLPDFAVTWQKYKQNNANEVTKAVCAFIELRGGRADRINTQGQWDEKRNMWRKGQTRKGVADIIACIEGRYVAIEVKFGKDRQSKEQKTYQQAVVDASGHYFIARDFDSFYNWYRQTFIQTS